MPPLITCNDEILKDNIEIKNPKDISKIMYAITQRERDIDREKERFYVIGLNSRLQIKYIELISLGTLNASLVHPREVFRFAIMQNVAEIILAHNHPSGNPEPSGDDLTMTKRLVESGKMLGIKVTDHVIIGNIETDKEFSFKGKNLI